MHCLTQMHAWMCPLSASRTPFFNCALQAASNPTSHMPHASRHSLQWQVQQLWPDACANAPSMTLSMSARPLYQGPSANTMTARSAGTTARMQKTKAINCGRKCADAELQGEVRHGE
eukprot:352955-Chlamydomonas_euryale.AAC.2